METYEFGYIAQNIKMVFDAGNLNYKLGLKKGSIETSKILHFRKFEFQDYDQIVIRYKNNEGKPKNFKAFVDKGSQGAQAFMYRLAEISPEKDLSNTPANEARKMLKIGNAAKGGFIGAAVIIIGILAFIFRGVFKDIKGNMPIIIIGGVVLLIIIGALVYVYFNGKHESKDW